ncbi:hypothetical protein [Rhizobium giardinii]|uniref:hypothetical protein n=1 Tax=Rhizobium giardinii TaxID=56731 RepID=UPI003D6FB48A
MRSFDRYLDVIETAVKNIDPITASGFKEALYHNLQDAIFGLAYDSEVLNRLRELDQPAQNLLEAVTRSLEVIWRDARPNCCRPWRGCEKR